MIDKYIEKNKAICTGCTSCYSICPVNAIEMKADNEGFMYPNVDDEKCIKCKKCINVCPTLNNSEYNRKDNVSAYAGYLQDLDIRLSSSSGGIFTVLASKVLKENGVVYGAAFDDCWNVCHIRITDIDSLKFLRGSKYVQSSLGDTFLKCLEDLKKGNKVLFSGTPCQVAGLKAFIPEEYVNLVTVDFICHGVPSPLVWYRYVSESFPLKNISSINFRSKEISGWKNYIFEVCQNNCDNYYSKPEANEYMLGFLRNLFLRKSCYNCNFKSVVRVSDITIADFWGVEAISPDIDDNRGTSLIFIQSKKGEEIFNSIKDNIVIKSVDVDTVLKYNSAMIESVKYHKNRDRFFSELSNCESVALLIDKYVDDRSFRKKLSAILRSKIKGLIK